MAKESQSVLRRWWALQWKFALLSLLAHLALAFEFSTVPRTRWLISMGLLQLLVAALSGYRFAGRRFMRGRRKDDPEWLFIATEPSHLRSQRDRRTARRREQDRAEIQ